MRFDSKICVVTQQATPNGFGGYKMTAINTKELDCFITPVTFKDEELNERDTTTHAIKFFTKGDINHLDKTITFEGNPYTVTEFTNYGKLKMAVARCDKP